MAFPLLWRVVAPAVAGVGVVSAAACSPESFSSAGDLLSSWASAAGGWASGSTATAGASSWTGSETAGCSGASCSATPFS